MRVAISGATGLIGAALARALEAKGQEVVRLVRTSARSADEIAWDPERGTIEADKLEGLDALVHLAGENLAKGRWTAGKKARIRDSRVKGTGLLAETVARLQRPPMVWVAASAIGYYGDRGNEVMRESSLPGIGFLADVCRAWERATQPAVDRGVRVVNLRIGVVLSRRGGALKEMLTPFKLGVGGKVGSGAQYISWITLDDLVAVIEHVLTHGDCQGPVNAVAPQPVTNLEFTKALGAAVGRPTVMPMPAFAARLAFGEVADELLLSSTRVEPTRLQETGFTFRHPRLVDALRDVLAEG